MPYLGRLRPRPSQPSEDSDSYFPSSHFREDVGSSSTEGSHHAAGYDYPAQRFSPPSHFGPQTRNYVIHGSAPTDGRDYPGRERWDSAQRPSPPGDFFYDNDGNFYIYDTPRHTYSSDREHGNQRHAATHQRIHEMGGVDRAFQQRFGQRPARRGHEGREERREASYYGGHGTERGHGAHEGHYAQTDEDRRRQRIEARRRAREEEEGSYHSDESMDARDYQGRGARDRGRFSRPYR